MKILVLLTAFLLAASSNPIGNSREDSVGAASHNEAEDDESQLSGGDNITTDTNEPPSSIDEVSHSTEHTGDVPNENSHNGDVHNEDTRNEDMPSGGAGDENSDNEDTRNSNSNNEDAYNGNAHNGGVHTSAVGTASTTPTTSPTGEDSETKNVTLPADADPRDCRARNPKKHIYLACQFSCEGDMMELALDNATCLLNYTENLADENNSTRPNWNKTGVCQKGNCVPNPSEVTEATPESSPTETTATTGFTATSPESSPTGTTTAAGVAENASEAVTSETTTSPESSSPETTASAKNSEMDSKTTAEPSPPTPDFSPVAMP